MRTSILGIPNFDKIDAVVDNTRKITKCTHADPRCAASSIAVTHALALMLQGNKNVEEIIEQSVVRAVEELTDEENKEERVTEFKKHAKHVPFITQPN